MLQALFKKHNSFLRPWKKKGFTEEKVTTIGLYDLGTSHDSGIQQEPLKKAIRRNGVPETITIDGSDAHEAAIKSYNQAYGTAIAIRQVKDLHNVVEQDHRAVKRLTRLMLGFKSCTAAHDTLVGIELVPMIKKRQLVVEERDEGRTAAERFYSLAA